MQRSTAIKVFASLSVLTALTAVQLWGSYPIYSPPIENGPEEVRLAPRPVIPFTGTVDHSRLVTTFGGKPYLVGPIVLPTSTLSEAETNVAINPNDPTNLVAVITDYSLRPGSIYV